MRRMAPDVTDDPKEHGANFAREDLLTEEEGFDDNNASNSERSSTAMGALRAKVERVAGYTDTHGKKSTRENLLSVPFRIIC